MVVAYKASSVPADPQAVVGVVMFLFFLSMSIAGPAVPQVMLHLSCLQLGVRGDAACSASTDASSVASSWGMWMSVCESIPAILLAGGFGAVSDAMGRRPLLLLGATAQLISLCTFVTVVLFELPLSVLLVSSAIVGVSGGFVCIIANLFGIIADTTTASERTSKFVRLEAALFAGTIVGPPFGGYLIKAHGFVAPFLAAALLCCCNWCMVWAVLVETKARSGSGSGSWAASFCGTNTVKLLRDVSLRSRRSVTLSAIFFLTAFPIFGFFGLFILFAKLRFALSATTIGLYQMCESIFRTLIVLGAAHVKEGHCHCNCNCYCCGGGHGGGGRGRGRGRGVGGEGEVEVEVEQEEQEEKVVQEERERAETETRVGMGVDMKVGMVVGMWYFIFVLAIPVGCAGVVLPTVRALFSTQVSADEQGMTLTAIAALENIVKVCSSLVFVPIYRASVGFFPGLAFVIMGLLLALAAACIRQAATVIEPADAGSGHGRGASGGGGGALGGSSQVSHVCYGTRDKFCLMQCETGVSKCPGVSTCKSYSSSGVCTYDGPTKRTCIQDPTVPCCGPKDPKEQCDALKAFFVAASKGDGWLLRSNWLMGGSFCAPAPNGWYGITCVGGKIQKIDLPGNGLQGTLAPTVFTAFASSLVEFNVAQNPGLGGSIPATIGKATNLCVFNAYGCGFTGTIPDVFSDLNHFTPKYCPQPRFDLHFNFLLGPLAASIGDMDGLTYFSCANNNISGTIPKSFAKLTDLETLGLAHNPHLTGSIKVLAPMTKLKVVFLRNCSFDDELIAMPKSLAVLDVDHNQFTSVDPQFCAKASGMPALGNTGGCESDWPKQPLGTCCLASNSFVCKSGSPPACLKNCEMTCGAPTPPPTPSTCTEGGSEGLAGEDCAVWKDLYFELDGPTWSHKCVLNNPCDCAAVKCNVTDPKERESHIVELDMAGIGAKGDLPPTISYLKHLSKLDLSGNNITSIPESICDLPEAVFAGNGSTCALSGNPLDCSHGPTPLCVRKSCGAGCSGECLGASSYLHQDDCSAWQSYVRNSSWFTSAKPAACQELSHLADPCSCTGVISCADGRIVGVDLGNRSLTLNADADDSLSRLGGLQNLSLGTWPNPTNQLVGPMPSWLGKLAGSLVHLDMACNKLSGPIGIVRGLKNLEYLDLGTNANLNGTIEAVAGLTKLTLLDLISCGGGSGQGDTAQAVFKRASASGIGHAEAEGIGDGGGGNMGRPAARRECECAPHSFAAHVALY
eukprot:g619.t1